jgi:hypothetical protein
MHVRTGCTSCRDRAKSWSNNRGGVPIHDSAISSRWTPLSGGAAGIHRFRRGRHQKWHRTPSREMNWHGGLLPRSWGGPAAGPRAGRSSMKPASVTACRALQTLKIDAPLNNAAPITASFIIKRIAHAIIMKNSCHGSRSLAHALQKLVFSTSTEPDAERSRATQSNAESPSKPDPESGPLSCVEGPAARLGSNSPSRFAIHGSAP